MLVSEQQFMFDTLDRLMLEPGLITGSDRSFISTVNRLPATGQTHLPKGADMTELRRIFDLYNDEIKL